MLNQGAKRKKVEDHTSPKGMDQTERTFEAGFLDPALEAGLTEGALEALEAGLATVAAAVLEAGFTEEALEAGLATA